MRGNRILEKLIAVFSRMRGNRILERLTVQDSNTPRSCDYRYTVQDCNTPHSCDYRYNHQLIIYRWKVSLLVPRLLNANTILFLFIPFEFGIAVMFSEKLRFHVN